MPARGTPPLDIFPPDYVLQRVFHSDYCKADIRTGYIFTEANFMILK